jgi:hypothetical protein
LGASWGLLLPDETNTRMGLVGGCTMTQSRKSGGSQKRPSAKKPGSAESAAKKSGVLVSVADSHLERMPEVADELRAAGLDISHVLNTTGTITGSMDSSKVDDLKGIPGVSAVEVEQSYQLPPPDSEIQ